MSREQAVTTALAERTVALPLEIQVALIEQEHRIWRIIDNRFLRPKREQWDVSDPRWSAARSAFIWRLFARISATAAVITAGAGLTAGATLYLTWKTYQAFLQQNAQIVAQNRLIAEQLVQQEEANSLFRSQVTRQQRNDRAAQRTGFVSALYRTEPNRPDHPREHPRIRTEAAIGLVALDRSDGRAPNLALAHLEETSLGELDLDGARLRGANLAGADLRNGRLQGADLQGAQFIKVVLRSPEIAGGRYTGADFVESALKGHYFANIKPLGARLGGADLTGADLRGANFVAVDEGVARLIAEAERYADSQYRATVSEQKAVREAVFARNAEAEEVYDDAAGDLAGAGLALARTRVAYHSAVLAASIAKRTADRSARRVTYAAGDVDRAQQRLADARQSYLETANQQELLTIDRIEEEIVALRREVKAARAAANADAELAKEADREVSRVYAELEHGVAQMRETERLVQQLAIEKGVDEDDAQLLSRAEAALAEASAERQVVLSIIDEVRTSIERAVPDLSSVKLAGVCYDTATRWPSRFRPPPAQCEPGATAAVD